MTLSIRSLLFAAAVLPGTSALAASQPPPIKHVIIIMQENRSFDSYFGTYPGANGIPAGTCVPIDPTVQGSGCVAPFHDPHDVNSGGPHMDLSAQMDLDDGITTNKLDGFIYAQTTANHDCPHPSSSNCAGSLEGLARHDVMGYHDANEIPNYWTYAQNFVLQDMMFEGERSWSYPSHIDMTSEWVAVCTDYTKVATCKTSNLVPMPDKLTTLPWANLFQLLDAHAVTWKYYLGQGDEPDCEGGEMDCPPLPQLTHVQSIWNPAPYYASVKAQGTAYMDAHIPALDQFYRDVENSTLPQVSWIVPAKDYSEHPVSSIDTGMDYVTALVNTIASSPYWQDTAIFITWDDWGGFYEHVVPPVVDTNTSKYVVQGFGPRVPGLLISAYAKRNMIDHSVLSTDSYAHFIEDLFTGGARLDPAQLGTPDSRPDIRDELTSVKFPNGTTAPIGNLMDEFDFKRAPRTPLILSPYIPGGIQVACRGNLTDHQIACTQPSVTISWAPVTSTQVPGPFTYHVTRDGIEIKQCIGTAASCVDTPGKGTHFYRAVSVDPSGKVSPTSAAAEADEP